MVPGSQQCDCLGVEDSTIACTSSAMAFQASLPSWLAATLALFSILSLFLPANALYFYAEGRQPKCFFEDLPKDTLVAGTNGALP